MIYCDTSITISTDRCTFTIKLYTLQGFQIIAKGVLVYYTTGMPSLDTKIQVKVSTSVQQRAKVVAASRGMTLTDLVLEALTKVGDDRLAALIKKESSDRNRPGRPTAR